MAVITRTIQACEKSAELRAMQQALSSLGASIASGGLFTAASAAAHPWRMSSTG